MKIDQTKFINRMMDRGISTQGELAQMAEWSQTWTSAIMRRIKNGEPLKLKSIQGIAAALGCSAKDIIEG